MKKKRTIIAWFFSYSFLRLSVLPIGVSLVLVLVCLMLSGCSSSSNPSSWTHGTSKIKVLSTTAMIDDLVARVGGEYVDHRTLISGELDPHSYELVKGDDEKIQGADLVVFNGLGLEHGASLRYWLQKHPRTLAVGDHVQKDFPEAMIYVDGEIDPHLWMDIALWSRIIDPIVYALSSLDPEHAPLFQDNGKKMQKEMLEAHEQIVIRLRSIPAKKRFLVTSHDAFNYFTKAYLADADEEVWKQRFAAPEGLAPDGQLSTGDIQRIIDHLCQYKIGVVFPESNVSKDSLKKIIASCKEMGHRVDISKEPLYGDAMGEKGSGADTYLTMIQYNVDVLLLYWGKKDE